MVKEGKDTHYNLKKGKMNFITLDERVSKELADEIELAKTRS